MSELKHELVNAGYIMTINRPVEGVRLHIPRIRFMPDDHRRLGGGPKVIDVLSTGEQISPFMQHLGFDDKESKYIYNLGAHFLLSGNPIEAVHDHADMTSTLNHRIIRIQGQTEKNLKSNEVQFHKLTAVMTLRPVTLEAACDAADLMRFHSTSGLRRSDLRNRLIPAFDAVKASLDELNKFHIGYDKSNIQAPLFVGGHLAIRRNKFGEDSYLQCSKHDQTYITNRKRLHEEEAERRISNPRPDYFEVSDLGRAFHFHSAKEALVAIAHFKTAAPGDKFFAAHAEYIVGEEPVSLTQMKEMALAESISPLDPKTQDMIKRLSQNKLAL